MSDRPEAEISRLPLHFFWVLDVSGSMVAQGKIQALNNAIHETIPALREEACHNPHIELMIRVLAFADEAEWVVGEPTPVDQFRWPGVAAVADGMTELGPALHQLSLAMHSLAEDGRGFTPAAVLVSDGRPTNIRQPTFSEALRELLAEPWGRRAVRMAVAIGRDADTPTLQRFIGREDLEPVQADSTEQLVDSLRWAATVASRMAASPAVSQAVPPSPTVTRLAPPPDDDHIWGQGTD
jgi:uncharacterized protein YegL